MDAFVPEQWRSGRGARVRHGGHQFRRLLRREYESKRQAAEIVNVNSPPARNSRQCCGAAVSLDTVA